MGEGWGRRDRWFFGAERAALTAFMLLVFTELSAIVLLHGVWPEALEI